MKTNKNAFSSPPPREEKEGKYKPMRTTGINATIFLELIFAASARIVIWSGCKIMTRTASHQNALFFLVPSPYKSPPFLAAKV
jgi:hypothetical protein